MANIKEQPGWCPNCNRQVLARKEEADNTFYLIATLLSCFIFVIPWIIIMLVKGSKPFLCPQCGSAVGSKPTNAQPVLSPAMRQMAAKNNPFAPAYQAAGNPTYQPANNSGNSKCSSCGLVNFATDTICKRCNNPLR